MAPFLIRPAPLPVAPIATPPPVMPDPMSPTALEAKRKAIGDAGASGRSSTTLTSAAARASDTLAGSYGAQKLGGA